MSQAEQIDPKPETARDRVRRLLIEPLQREGMRFKAGVSLEDQRRRLDQIADDCKHMSDVNLGRLRLCLRTKGEGSSKCFWPGRVTFLGFAQVAQPRPLEEVRGLKSWFASEAGRLAADEPGRLVAEFEFWERHHHPPFAPAHKARVGARAAELGHRVGIIADRERRGAGVSQEDADFITWYRAQRDLLMGWVREGRA